MNLFPAFLDLCGRPCLVAGGGRVGLAKARTLVAAGATVLVVDPAPAVELLAEAEASLGALAVESRVFLPGDCGGRFLVFACTGVASVDEAVASAAKSAGALCCRADGVVADFTTGAALRRGDLCIAVSSGGSSPALALEARDRAAGAVGDEFAEAARLLGDLRGQLRAAGLARPAVMDRSLVRGVLGALRSGDGARARAIVEEAFATARSGAGNSGDSCIR